MNKLKELIKEVEKQLDKGNNTEYGYLLGIKQTVEAFYVDCDMRFNTREKSQDFQKLKNLLDMK